MLYEGSTHWGGGVKSPRVRDGELRLSTSCCIPSMADRNRSRNIKRRDVDGEQNHCTATANRIQLIEPLRRNGE